MGTLDDSLGHASPFGNVPGDARGDGRGIGDCAPWAKFGTSCDAGGGGRGDLEGPYPGKGAGSGMAVESVDGMPSSVNVNTDAANAVVR